MKAMLHLIFQAPPFPKEEYVFRGKQTLLLTFKIYIMHFSLKKKVLLTQYDGAIIASIQLVLSIISLY